ncbi:hypothetical protein [Alteribacillus bidgolensis]|uniref:hypothetical protein n=1 Tax=Alteribacillus bidgolensis TaxID=930129 RepID=UPI0011135713|nr:hypothetical protein [Alteribacillus bidgolensis]
MNFIIYFYIIINEHYITFPRYRSILASGGRFHPRAKRDISSNSLCSFSIVSSLPLAWLQPPWQQAACGVFIPQELLPSATIDIMFVFDNQNSTYDIDSCICVILKI